MKIVAFSDYRVQDIPKTFEFVSKQKPDLILYAGDDVHRFAPLPKQQLEKLLKKADNALQEGIKIKNEALDNAVERGIMTTKQAGKTSKELRNNAKKGLHLCYSPIFDSWSRDLSDNSLHKKSRLSQLSECIFFNISISATISERKIKSKISNIVI